MGHQPRPLIHSHLDYRASDKGQGGQVVVGSMETDQGVGQRDARRWGSRCGSRVASLIDQESCPLVKGLLGSRAK